MNKSAVHFSELLGELTGTFILVFFGCGSVAVTVLFSAHTGLFQVAAIWGIGVALAIYSARHMSCAHFNPAVSIAMALAGRLKVSKLFHYLFGQFAGAFLAAAVLFLLFGASIAHFETLHGIVRGDTASVKTAMMFGEFYPNPGAGDAAVVTPLIAFLAEAIGTFALVSLIFSLTEGCNVGRPDSSLAPLLIGSTVTVIIGIIAPLTQAGLNPARDLAPRLFSYIAGWGQAAMPDHEYGFLTIYVIAPIVGGALAALLFANIIEPIMAKKNKAELAMDRCDRC